MTKPFPSLFNVLPCSMGVGGTRRPKLGVPLGLLLFGLISNAYAVDFTLKLLLGDHMSGIVVADAGFFNFTVCFSGRFDTKKASVVCSSLGLPSANPVILHPYKFLDPKGTSTSLRLRLNCSGNPERCEFQANGVTCKNVHAKDVPAVFCKDKAIEFQLNTLPGESIGRLEAKINETWGPVCATSSPELAKVACDAMGLPSTDSRLYTGLFRGGDFLPGYLELNSCIPDEAIPGKCATALAGAPCNRQAYVGLTCANASEGQVRLSGGLTGSQHGIAQVYHKGKWAGIGTSSSFTSQTEATVICRTLGFPTSNVQRFYHPSPRVPLWLDAVSCQGTEANLFNCSGSNLLTDTTEGLPVLQACELDDDTIRIGKDGLLEVRHYGRWGTVCASFFRNQDAAVMCDTLHLPSSLASWSRGSNSPKRTGTIWLDGMHCETSNWKECTHNDWGQADCSHNADVHVKCGSYDKAAVKYRLGSRPFPDINVGYVEILINNTWGTVCNRRFSTQEAEVACRSLNLNGGEARVIHIDYLSWNQNQKMWLDGLDCAGQEDSLLDCEHSYLGGESCSRATDQPVGIYCGASSEIEEGTLRLIGGSNRPGLVEIWMFGQWMTICDPSFGPTAASLTCYKLGYSRYNARVATKGTFQPGTGNIWPTRLTCTTDHGCMFPYMKMTTHVICDHSQDLALICDASSGASGVGPRVGVITRATVVPVVFLVFLAVALF